MEQSNIPGMLRRMLKLAKTTGTTRDKVLAPRYATKLEQVISELESEGEVLAVNFAQADSKPEGGK